MLLLVSAARRRQGHRQLCALLSQTAGRGRVRAPIVRSYSNAPPHHETNLEDIRNVGIIAHVDAGKTTTTERMLFISGVTRHLGNVDHGDTVTDFLPMERERGITIQSAAITFKWPLSKGGEADAWSKTINLIDTPGHQDFRFEVDRCLPILDGAVCIIDGVKGVEAHTERVWEAAQDFKIPRILYVNKLDRDGASFKRSVLDIGVKLNGFPLVCQIPWWSKEKFTGVIDVIDKIGYRGSPEKPTATVFPEPRLREELAERPELLEEIEIAHSKLVEELCMRDNILMAEFLESGSVAGKSIKDSIRRLINNGEGEVIPVFAGSSLKNQGVVPLLNAIVDYLPNPLDRPEAEVYVGPEKMGLSMAIEREIAAHSKPHNKVPSHSRIGAIAVVFKVINDPIRGMVSFVRCYHGDISKRASLWNSSTHSFEKPLALVQIAANKTREIPHLLRGHIGALMGLKSARTGDTLLTFPQHKSPPVPLKNMAIRPANIPPAVAFVSIDPQSPSAAKTLEEALEKASREDPSLRWNKDEKTDQYILSGMGKLHLEVAKHHLKTNYKVDAFWGGIEVDYKECILGQTPPHHHMYERNVLGKDGKAGCTATIKPLEEEHKEHLTEACYKRDDNVIHISILPPDEPRASLPFDPEVIRPPLLNGAIAGLASGPRRGSPLHGCHITLEFNSERDWFNTTAGAHLFGAAYRAVKECLKEANNSKMIGLLEPVMRVHINCPADVAGTVQHDLTSAAGGTILEINDDSAEGMESTTVDVSEIYAPPDPYDSVRGLKERSANTHMLEIVAKVPLKSMLDYDDHIRGKTAGRHTILMSLDTFERVVGHREKELDL